MYVICYALYHFSVLSTLCQQVKCEQYFPVESGGSVSAERFEVRVNSLKHHVDYEVRRIELEQVCGWVEWVCGWVEQVCGWVEQVCGWVE